MDTQNRGVVLFERPLIRTPVQAVRPPPRHCIVYVLSVAYALLFLWLAEQTGSGFYLEIGRQLPGQLSYFMAGAFFYYHLPVFERHAPYFIFSAVPILIADRHWPLAFLEPFALATTVIFLALFFYLGNFGKYGDFSYGVYILHFPIIQCFLHFGWFASSPWLFLMSITLTVSVAAIGMWHLVERRFLLHNSHYLTASDSATVRHALTHALKADAPDRHVG